MKGQGITGLEGFREQGAWGFGGLDLGLWGLDSQDDVEDKIFA